MSLMIKEFDIIGDRKRVPDVQVKRRMKVTKGKFGCMMEINLNEESEEFFNSLDNQIRILAGSYLNEKPWDFKFPSREYGPFRVIHCRIYSSCQLVNMKVGESFRGYCEMRPYHAFSGKTKGITLAANKIVR